MLTLQASPSEVSAFIFELVTVQSVSSLSRMCAKLCTDVCNRCTWRYNVYILWKHVMPIPTSPIPWKEKAGGKKEKGKEWRRELQWQVEQKMGQNERREGKRNGKSPNKGVRRETGGNICSWVDAYHNKVSRYLHRVRFRKTWQHPQNGKYITQRCSTRGSRSYHRKKSGCGPLDPAEIVSILAHNCFSLSDRLA